MFSSEALVRYKVNSDGRTPYESMTGHKCKVQAIAFGEAVQFMCTVDKGDRHKAESEWASGIFVGTISSSNAFLVVNEDGLFQCSRIQKRPDGNNYDPDCLENITTGIDDYVNKGAKSKAGVRFAEKIPQAPGQEPIPTAGGDYAPRRAKLTKPDFEEHGFTIQCPGCVWIQNQIGMKRGHTELCCERMELALNTSERGQERLRRQKDRSDHWLADQVDQADIEGQAEAAPEGEVEEVINEEEQLVLVEAPMADK